ncbi:TPA: hypothetical protein ACX6RX_003184 [Photobacterium damselae]
MKQTKRHAQEVPKFDWPDNVLIAGAYYHLTMVRQLKWTDIDRKWALNILEVTAEQTIDLANGIWNGS